MKTLLFTDASRGLGLEFAKRYLEDGWRDFACCLSLSNVSDLKISGLDLIAMDLDAGKRHF